MPGSNTRESSIPLKGGGDTHFDTFGPKATDFTVTTQLPGGIKIHNNPFDPGNPKTNNISYGKK